MCDFWARLESYGHGLLKTGWQGRPDMMGAMTGGNKPSIVERKKGGSGSCHLTPHTNTEEKHRPP